CARVGVGRTLTDNRFDVW
nr:immunoglobulin heavy chain junction region [Macaca mulatta]MOW87543.1 immunoglobulin heavy chain junction region [Macaca mulatta]MOW87872.1 immunoglobulin heavy chain junction region [Macaca mulatta]MOW88170.1 immunoglobulin heavy chain junction region [Macaca mulatta]MOW88271.1 immunoglobulin heavy chain junction region [Macaca mulatta]